MQSTTLAIDTMGGDHGPCVTVPAALKALAKYPQLHVILVGDERVIQQHLRDKKYDAGRLIIRHASQQVEMGELPSQALRLKKDSSMRIAINLVKENIAQACVSAGNTGALMATARYVLKMIPGIDRPAITATLPTEKTDHGVRILDLGANVDSSSDHLYQFAVMGSVVATAVDGINNPRIGLLNIGAEEIKGNDLVKQTNYLLEDSKVVNYVGYVEGDTLYTGITDVVVCDGFVGNAMLKASEGLAKLVRKMVKDAYTKNMFTKLTAFMSLPVLNSVSRRINPGRYNGASFLGLQGIVIKSHGSADKYAFVSAIHEAIIEVEKNVPKRIQEEVTKLLDVEP